MSQSVGGDKPQSGYKYETASQEPDDMFELDMRNGPGSADNSTMFHGGGGGNMFEEDGDAGSPSPSVFKLNRQSSNLKTNPETKTTASGPVVSTGRSNDMISEQSRVVKKIPSNLTSSPPQVKQFSSPSVMTSLKSWSLNTFNYTKQYVSERLWQSPRTVDPETEARVEALRETQRQYLNILRLSRALYIHFQRMVQTQRVLGEAFADLSQTSSELTEQFSYNAETQKLLSKNGDILLASLNVFMTSISTLCNTTIEDTLLTVKNYEATRIKYDANRLHLENLKLQQKDASMIGRLQEAERLFQQHKHRYDRLHNDLIIKLKFLDENKVNVCQKHLYLFHKGFISYVSGNREGLEEVLRHFSATSKFTLTDSASSSDERPESRDQTRDQSHDQLPNCEAKFTAE